MDEGRGQEKKVEEYDEEKKRTEPARFCSLRAYISLLVENIQTTVQPIPANEVFSCTVCLWGIL